MSSPRFLKCPAGFTVLPQALGNHSFSAFKNKNRTKMMLHGHRLMAFLACVCMSVQRKLISSSDLDNVINLYAVMVCMSVLECSVFKKKVRVSVVSVAPQGSVQV